MEGTHIPDNREEVYLISLGKLSLVLDILRLLCWGVLRFQQVSITLHDFGSLLGEFWGNPYLVFLFDFDRLKLGFVGPEESIGASWSKDPTHQPITPGTDRVSCWRLARPLTMLCNGAWMLF